MSDMPGQPYSTEPPATAPPARAPGPQPRRLSIFSGVLWIVIGGLLLANNLVANLRIWDLFWNYWPVLLILLGVAKLFDHFASQRSGAPPARLLSGGEIFLIILLLIVGGSVGTIRRIGDDHPDIDIRFPWDNTYTFSEELSKEAVAGRPVRIDIPRGSITVVADETSQIRVLVNKRARGVDEEQAKERAKDSGIEIVEMDNTFVIRRRAGSESFVRFDVEVRLPKKSTLTARTERGSANIQGIEGDLKVDANGSIEIRNVKGNVEAKVDGDALIIGASGDVRVDGDCRHIEIADVTGGAAIRCGFRGRATLRNIAKHVYFKSVRTEFQAGTLPGRMVIGEGDLEVSDAPKDVTLITQHYDILLDNVAGQIRVENRNGDVEVRMPKAPTAEISITNQRGGIDLVLPSNSAFEVSATSDRGDLETDFDSLTVNERNREKRMEGKVGAGGPKIRLSSTYDDVRLRKGT